MKIELITNNDEIVVNGRRLHLGHRMAVTSALIHFREYLLKEGLGDDNLGKSICKGYLDRSAEILAMLKDDA